MVKDNAEKVIKPPAKFITSGTIFKPSKALLHKMLVQYLIVFAFIWLCTVGSFVFVAYMNALEGGNPSATQTITDYWVTVNIWTVLVNLIWFAPAIALTPAYVKSIEYSVKAESGDTMPEIYSKRGIITVTRRHVPFRTITNISSKAGPMDRIFKIGSVQIETAGNSGANQKGPEETLSGIVFYEEVRDFILKELRKFRDPYVTGTEVVYPTEEATPKMQGNDEVLATLREIRDILKEKA
ncbi:MAG: PH domain-containing protein [Candidatus Bathyarchaeia archaeon]